MTHILKRPSDSAGSLKLPVRSTRPPARAAALAEPPKAAQPIQPAPVMPAAELEALREQAHREGLAQARQAAEKELRATLEQHAELWRAALEAVEVAITARLEALETLAVSIAYEAAAQVLGSACERDGMVQVVRSLLARSAGAAELTLHVAPDLVPLLRTALERDPQWQHRRLRVEADASLPPGGCRVTSERGVLETSLRQQLQGIQDALLAAAERAAMESTA